MEGSVSVLVTNGSGCWSGKPKNIRNLRIRIHNTGLSRGHPTREATKKPSVVESGSRMIYERSEPKISEVRHSFQSFFNGYRYLNGFALYTELDYVHKKSQLSHLLLFHYWQAGFPGPKSKKNIIKTVKIYTKTDSVSLQAKKHHWYGF